MHRLSWLVLGDAAAVGMSDHPAAAPSPSCRDAPPHREGVVPGAHHDVFISNEEQVDRAMRAFLDGKR